MHSTSPKTATRILLWNVGYCTGMDGSLGDYFFHFFRYFHTPRRIIRSVLTNIDHIVDGIRPDICCFLEVRRIHRFMQKLWEYPFFSFENKYGLHSIFRKLPVLRKNRIGFFAKQDLSYRKHYFRHGMKKLVYEITLREGTSVLISHFALRRRVRKKQFAEMRELIKKRKRVILCGDFNLFSGRKELDELARECGLRVVNASEDKTFPAEHPKRAIDLFLCSQDVHIRSLRVVRNASGSDHLPVVLEVDVRPQ